MELQQKNQISAVLVTRGNNDISPVLALLRYYFDDVVVYNNSVEEDQMVYGRYEAIKRCKHDIIYIQDDDCLVDIPKLIEAYDDDNIIYNAMREDWFELYPDAVTLIGWGAIFDRRLTDVFKLYLKHFPKDELFFRECDRVFTGLNKTQSITQEPISLPTADSVGRMSSETRHWDDLKTIRERINHVKRMESGVRNGILEQV